MQSATESKTRLGYKDAYHEINPNPNRVDGINVDTSDQAVESIYRQPEVQQHLVESKKIAEREEHEEELLLNRIEFTINPQKHVDKLHSDSVAISAQNLASNSFVEESVEGSVESTVLPSVVSPLHSSPHDHAGCGIQSHTRAEDLRSLQITEGSPADEQPEVRNGTGEVLTSQEDARTSWRELGAQPEPPLVDCLGTAYQWFREWTAQATVTGSQPAQEERQEDRRGGYQSQHSRQRAEPTGNPDNSELIAKEGDSGEEARQASTGHFQKDVCSPQKGDRPVKRQLPEGGAANAGSVVELTSISSTVLAEQRLRRDAEQLPDKPSVDPLPRRRVIGVSQLKKQEQDQIVSLYGTSEDIVVSPKELPQSFSCFLGTIQFPGSDRKLSVYNANLSDVGTSDLFLSENATLIKHDRERIVESLTEQLAGKDNQKEPCVLKKSDVFIHDGNGKFKTKTREVVPNNQVCDFSHGYNLNVEVDFEFAKRSMLNKPRLIVLSGWLEGHIDPEEKLEHLTKAIELCYQQHEAGRGFLFIVEPLPAEADLVYRKCEPLRNSGRSVTEIPVSSVDSSIIQLPGSTSFV